MFSRKSSVWIFAHRLASRELAGSPMSTEPSKCSYGMDKTRTLPLTKASCSAAHGAPGRGINNSGSSRTDKDDIFEELSALSLTLQRNDLILPQATSEWRKTVTRLEALKLRAKAGGMLEKIQTMLA